MMVTSGREETDVEKKRRMIRRDGRDELLQRLS